MTSEGASEGTDRYLFDRSVATLVRSWTYLASGSPGAKVVELGGAAVAAFPAPPERQFLNNALLERDAGDPGPAIEAVERIYAQGGIERFAIWAHETEADAIAALKSRGYTYDSSTRTMAMPLTELAAGKTTALDLVPVTPAEFWRVDGEIDGLVPNLTAAGGHFYVARFEGEPAAMLMACDYRGDCGIYMVGTRPPARRQGLATALSAHAVAAARARDCTTASLQATAMAEGVYASVGFRDLGRFVEYVPGPQGPAGLRR